MLSSKKKKPGAGFMSIPHEPGSRQRDCFSSTTSDVCLTHMNNTENHSLGDPYHRTASTAIGGTCAGTNQVHI